MFGIVILLGTLSNAALGDFELKMLIHGLMEVPLSQRIYAMIEFTLIGLNRVFLACGEFGLGI